MAKHLYNQFDFEDQLDELGELGKGGLPQVRNAPTRRKQKNKNASKGKFHQELVEGFSSVSEQIDDRSSLNFTYQASRSEVGWLLDSLGVFYEQQWFEDVLRLVKGGKEASVYQCLGNHTTREPFLAAKVYRPRQFRNLKNDHMYREGRERFDADGITIIDGRMHKAMNQRTAFGRELMHTSWLQHEYKTMELFYQAGIDVPKPYARSSNAILMSYIGSSGLAAPTLNEVKLGFHEARLLFARTIRNIDRMLSLNRIHGDLSAYNILYWEGSITFIDFPQTIEPGRNRNAYMIFERDVLRVCEYFEAQGVHTRPMKLAANLWQRHQAPYFPEVDPAFLDDQDESDLDFWFNYLDKIGK